VANSSVLKKRIAILASGAGSNTLNIIRHFEGSDKAEVALIASNKPQAGVLQIALDHQIPKFILTKENFRETDVFIEELLRRKIDLIVLAGFLQKIPGPLISVFEGKIINIHPALLPDFGGKGMYGHFVHEAVHASGAAKSGITVHQVNEQYDEGQIIFQAEVDVDETDTPESIEKKVRALEIQHFPSIIESLI
jgi:phosphoribosylglycinamide formyltransferase 1